MPFNFAFRRFGPQRPALVGRGVFNFTVSHAAFVIRGKVLGDGQSLGRDKQQAMAIFVDVHVIARTDPRAVLDLFSLVRVVAAGTQRPPQRVKVMRKSQLHALGHALVGMRGRAGVLAIVGHQFVNALKTIRAGVDCRHD